ncbi:hypothetical protein PGTUg99_035732 [Puccinia graminis f. sp. tritici]|uniref:Uncharacterized protein n=1 Tax=Puccinia graminis f. sp. tritici TaxID=56615 RepID=A0A5B0NPU7_PUCGR|nr:hypothetical protein PGTUg99_035732 [Puccinia graminis f. sp. tritici]
MKMQRVGELYWSEMRNPDRKPQQHDRQGKWTGIGTVKRRPQSSAQPDKSQESSFMAAMVIKPSGQSIEREALGLFDLACP